MILTASGLVFASGTSDRMLRAYNIDSGDELWRYKLPSIGSAVPMTYRSRGRQFVVVTSGLSMYTDGDKMSDFVYAFSTPDFMQQQDDSTDSSISKAQHLNQTCIKIILVMYIIYTLI